ncbi:MAG: hypothetical protein A2516_00085 [Alphaproteobacteria bacterium RIFOXYD12_FULL_60_8]|nr:MAG: hypothetical protein A2516_00085 [Alphaproteobacteria bacterium RIFOXYD12_FULL_60_8]
MRVNLNERIAGQPVAKVRDLLKRGFGWSWDTSYVVKRLDVDRAGAKKVVAALRKRGYIRKTASTSSGEDLWDNTIQGNAFGNASAAKPLLRTSADQRLKEFLARIEDVAKNPQFLYRVSTAILFGSYLTLKDRINDIDLYLNLVPKEKDAEKRQRLEQRRTEEAVRQGRTFNTFIDQISWPQTDVLKFLKARSRSISLHTDDRILKYGKSKVIYTDRS